MWGSWGVVTNNKKREIKIFLLLILVTCPLFTVVLCLLLYEHGLRKGANFIGLNRSTACRSLLKKKKKKTEISLPHANKSKQGASIPIKVRKVLPGCETMISFFCLATDYIFLFSQQVKLLVICHDCSSFLCVPLPLPCKFCSKWPHPSLD